MQHSFLTIKRNPFSMGLFQAGIYKFREDLVNMFQFISSHLKLFFAVVAIRSLPLLAWKRTPLQLLKVV